MIDINLLQTEKPEKKGMYLKGSNLAPAGEYFFVNEVKLVKAYKQDEAEPDVHQLMLVEESEDDESDNRLLTLNPKTAAGNASTKQRQFMNLIINEGWQLPNDIDPRDGEKIVISIDSFIKNKNGFEVLIKPRDTTTGVTIDILTAAQPKRKTRKRVTVA